jgi:hypothetical protein
MVSLALTLVAVVFFCLCAYAAFIALQQLLRLILG